MRTIIAALPSFICLVNCYLLVAINNVHAAGIESSCTTDSQCDNPLQCWYGYCTCPPALPYQDRDNNHQCVNYYIANKNAGQWGAVCYIPNTNDDCDGELRCLNGRCRCPYDKANYAGNNECTSSDSTDCPSGKRRCVDDSACPRITTTCNNNSTSNCVSTNSCVRGCCLYNTAASVSFNNLGSWLLLIAASILHKF